MFQRSSSVQRPIHFQFNGIINEPMRLCKDQAFRA
uniref:Uncharacterized protein n=1 Tax=Anguilla anguilla TaxID=7936 RepID=A0A0E9UGA7_ANGAN